MRQHSPQLEEVLSHSFTRQLLVNVFHGTTRVHTDLRMESWQLEGDLGSQVKLSGAGVIVFDSVAGESLLPVGTKGDLSPYRARLELVMEISAGDFTERISLGMFRLVRNPEARDYTATVNGQPQVIASRVGVSFRSLDENTRRWGLRFPEQPPQLASCYDELRRLTSMPVEETLTDKPIPAGTTWEAKQGGRLEAVQTLATILGGTGVVNSRGAWEIVPEAIGSPVGTIRLGPNGTVIDVGYEVDTDTVYNEVVGVFEDEHRNALFAVATAPAGSDLDPAGLYEPNTRYYSSPFVKTQAQADAAVRSILDLSIGGQMYDVPIQCHINPLHELGDVLALEEWDRPLVGQLVKFSMSDSALMNVTLRAHRPL